MDSPKYLIIVTLIDGQNFTVPDGLHEKIEATVFAEARFGNESVLKSDPVKLTNSNPEFVTELAWQLDKRCLHQLRVERKAIKLQIFMQTRSRAKGKAQTNNAKPTSNGAQSAGDSNATNHIELIGYTILDIRSAQESDHPKFQWLPLLNPKFRKSSYNRPEVQLAVTLSRVIETPDGETIPIASTSPRSKLEPKRADGLEVNTSSHESEADSSIEDRQYKTCLDFTVNSVEHEEKDEIIENDISIRSIAGYFYIYDTRDSVKNSIDHCDENYRISVTIPFASGLELLVKKLSNEQYYFSVTLFETLSRTAFFDELTSVETKEVFFNIKTTDASILSTYFELNPSLVIKLHHCSGETIGITSIQLDQLCSLELKRRSIEGIFVLEAIQDNDIPSNVHPSIGVSVVLERAELEKKDQVKILSNEHLEMAKQHFGDAIDDLLEPISFNDTHQLTGRISEQDKKKQEEPKQRINELVQKDDHHFCFTIDLKNFSYTQSQRLIPTLRELVVRYSYPFFGYKDTITTDSSIPISSTSSIIVSGFCEFNFATSLASLLVALKEIPLTMDILTCDQAKRVQVASDTESVVAMCNLNLAKTLELDETTILELKEQAKSVTVSEPIHTLEGEEVGELQIYLCLKDLGHPSFSLKTSVENLDLSCVKDQEKESSLRVSLDDSQERMNSLISETRNSIETWKDESLNRLEDDARRRETDRFRRLTQRIEAKEAKREQEFRKKMDDLADLEKRYKTAIVHMEELEKRLTSSLEALKTKDAQLDSRMDSVDEMIDKAVINIKQECEKKLESNSGGSTAPRRHSDETTNHRTLTRISARSATESLNQTRRSSLKTPNASNTSIGIPLPTRSTSLIRGSSESSSSTRLTWKPTGVVATVINGAATAAANSVSARQHHHHQQPQQRSSSNRLSLSRETQDKLASLRKEKAELLKRGCKPNDEMIREINSMIEKLAC